VTCCCALAAPAARAQEVFSWWRRGLLPLVLEPGSWVLMERVELAEGRTTRDSIQCAVLAAEGDGTRWVQLHVAGEPAGWVLRVDPARLSAERDLLDGVVELYRLGEQGEVAPQDLSELRENRLVRRHFEDLFEHPRVERNALPDTEMAGETLGRERVALTETREQRVPMGRRTLVHRTTASSVAQISPAVPIFHLLQSTTTTRVETESDPPDPRRRAPPPLITELRLRCVGFGRDGRSTLPEAVTAARPRRR
jgi:hypothetical protein